MKTTLDILLILYKVISQTSGITGTITGGVYKDQRPLNSDKEDIVIVEAPISGGQLQQCKPTINIHVPNKQIFIEGQQDLTQPDSERINQLTKIVWDAIAEKYETNYWFYADDEQRVTPQGNEHYSSITINFNILNTN